MSRRIIITGGLGQLGWELQRTKPAHWEAWITDVDEMDITDRESVSKAFQSFKPELVINAAAYTAVDRAEDEKELAYKVNRDGVENIVLEAKNIGCRVIHISTDFIFDGNSGLPYRPDDRPNPLSVYGSSKLAGENVIRELYPDGSVIVRTAWLYSAHGNNFVKTMLRLFQERSVVQVVSDQIGTPTWAFNLARFLWFLADCPTDLLSDLCYHFTDAGVASWYDFAVAIEEETRPWRDHPVEIMPIKSADYPTRAVRPHFSLLDKESTWKLWGEKPQHWRKALRAMLKEYRDYNV